MDQSQTTRRPSLAVFGDSHHACVKRAVARGLVDTRAVELEFWGHAGDRFRQLRFANGAITPTDGETAESFARLSTRNRRCLPISDFDWIFFMGCRIPGFGLFGALIQEERRGGFLTEGLKRRMVKDRLNHTPAYRFAVEAVAQGQTRVAVAPLPFPTGLAPFFRRDEFPDVRDASAEEREEIWTFYHEVMAQDGLILIRPPEDTFVSGLYCDPAYAAETYRKTGDMMHKNAKYGARILHRVLDLIALEADGKFAAGPTPV